MFDAGAIEARLTVRTDQFSRSLDAAEARVKRFETGKHEVRISAVFDQASLGHARQVFTQLDQQLSREAMQRLRGSPQGSVLGALNALFSPHPVTGAPSPQQSASQGLLGRIVQAPGGGVTGRTQAQQQATTQDQRATTSAVARLLAAFGGGGGGGGRVTAGQTGGPRDSTSFLGRLLGGIGPNVLGIGTRASLLAGLGGTALGALPALTAGVGALGVGAAGLGVAALGAKELIGTKQDPGQLYAQGQAAGDALQKGLKAGMQPLVPALRQVLGQIPSLIRGILPDLKALFAGAATLLQPALRGLTDLAHAVLPALGAAFRAVAPLIKPLLDGLAALVGPLLGGLTVLLKAAAPAVAAFSEGLGDIGRGLGTMFRQFAPVIKASATILSALFDVISGLFPIVGALAGVFARTLAPVFVQFAGVIKSLMPFLLIIGRVLASLAGAILGDLVAAFTALATLLKAIAPGLAAFAQAFSQVFQVLENTGVFAILGDALESLVKPLATLINALLKGLTPLLPPIIGFISQLSGILIGALVKALTAVIPPLTKLATDVLGTIAAILPAVLPLLVSLAGIFTGALVQVITSLADALNMVVSAIPPKVLGGIVLGILGIVSAIKLFGAASALISTFAAANPLGLILVAVGLLVIGIAELATHWNQVWTNIKNWTADAGRFLRNLFHNQIVQDILAVWTAGLLPLALHWNQVLTNLKNWTYNDFLLPIGRFFTVTLPGWWDASIGFLNRRFVTPFRNGISGAWNWVVRNVWNPVSRFLTSTLPGWFSTAVSKIGRFWRGVQNTVLGPIKWVFHNVLDPLGTGFDFITNALGLGKPIKVPIVAGWASGGKITQGTHSTADDVLARVSKDETILSAAHSKMLAPLLALIGVPGYAAGGTVGGGPPVPPGRQGALAGPGSGTRGGGNLLSPIVNAFKKAYDLGRITAAIATGNSVALTNALTALLGHPAFQGAGEMLKIVTAIPRTVIRDAVTWLLGSGGGPGGLIVGPGPAAAGPLQAYARQLLAQYGWASQWAAFNDIVMRESGWNVHATNPTSGAYGIPQALPPGKMASAGADWRTSGYTQLRWMMAYIRSMWRTPALADAHERAFHWYGNGGVIPEPVLGYGLASGDRYMLAENGSEAVTPIGGNTGGDGVSLADLLARLDRLIAVMADVPARTAGGVAKALSAQRGTEMTAARLGAR